MKKEERKKLKAERDAINELLSLDRLHKLIRSKEKDLVRCTHCNSRGVVKFGIRRGIQWYKCKGCEKTFSSVTDTFLEGTKKKFAVWRKFVKCMIDGRTVRDSAKECKIDKNTAFVWRHKFLDALAEYQDKRLRGIIEVDDTFFKLSFKGNKPIGRKAHRRGRRSTMRGISREKVSVSCAIDRKGRICSRVTALGRPTAQVLGVAFRRKFSRKNTTLCSDKDSAIRKFAKNNHFRHRRFKGPASRKGRYHIQHVNAYHSRLKRFIKGRFIGVSTKYLNNYLIWQNFIREKKLSRKELLNMWFMSSSPVTRWNTVSCRPQIPTITVKGKYGSVNPAFRHRYGY